MRNKEEVMKRKVVEVLKIAKRYRLTAKDLREEAECVENYCEWIIGPLMGYFEDELREAAKYIEENKDWYEKDINVECIFRRDAIK